MHTIFFYAHMFCRVVYTNSTRQKLTDLFSKYLPSVAPSVSTLTQHLAPSNMEWR